MPSVIQHSSLRNPQPSFPHIRNDLQPPPGVAHAEGGPRPAHYRVSSNCGPGPAPPRTSFLYPGLGGLALKLSGKHGGPRGAAVRSDLSPILPGWRQGLRVQRAAVGRERRQRRYQAGGSSVARARVVGGAGPSSRGGGGCFLLRPRTPEGRSRGDCRAPACQLPRCWWVEGS